jgi:hypothetical protein
MEKLMGSPFFMHRSRVRSPGFPGLRVVLAAWVASGFGGPWRAALAAPLLRITEVMSKTHDTDPEPDWFELTNSHSARG